MGKTIQRRNGRERKKWRNIETDKAMKERNQLNRKFNSMRKNREDGDKERTEYERASNKYYTRKQKK